jgi:hypothetical protein
MARKAAPSGVTRSSITSALVIRFASCRIHRFGRKLTSGVAVPDCELQQNQPRKDDGLPTLGRKPVSSYAFLVRALTCLPEGRLLAPGA